MSYVPGASLSASFPLASVEVPEVVPFTTDGAATFTITFAPERGCPSLVTVPVTVCAMRPAGKRSRRMARSLLARWLFIRPPNELWLHMNDGDCNLV